MSFASGGSDGVWAAVFAFLNPLTHGSPFRLFRRYKANPLRM